MTHASVSDSPVDGRRTAGRELVEQALYIARSAVGPDPDDWIQVEVPSPSIAPEALVIAFPREECVFWSPPSGLVTVGLGVAASFLGEGSNRFASLRRQAEKLWPRLSVAGFDSRPLLGSPRLFGGFAFSPVGGRSQAWSSFGPARFVLPTITYVQRGNQSALTVALRRSELSQGASAPPLRLLERVAAVVASAGELPAIKSSGGEIRRENDPAAYRARVADIVARIAAGQFDKVMTAQEVRLHFLRGPDAGATSLALRDPTSGCCRFMFRFGGAAFLGATPECLLDKRGMHLETEALAGTAARGEGGEGQRLQASPKILDEHRLVVSDIADSLSPLCEQLEVAEVPEVRQLRHLLHLCTPIRGRLAEQRHVLELIESLHPTPAVGGSPRAPALAWIEQNEPFDRGWYAGAIGWFDSAGDGLFNVALRSGLVNGDAVCLYAGAGIVRDSAPDAEYEETTLKLRSLRAALHSSP